MKRSFALAAGLLIWNEASESAPIPPPLATHRAVYEVSLDHTNGSDFVAAKGRMAVQVKNTCDGWSTTQRMIADMTDSSGTLTVTDYFVTSWESKDGRIMRFDVSDMRDGKVSSRLRGSAVLGPNGAGRVEFASGRHAGFTLPKGTEFPTAQLLDVLKYARQNATSYKHIVYEGGDRNTLNFATAIIGKEAKAGTLAADRAADKSQMIRSVPAWPVLISSFPLSARAEQPDYEVATHLFANGISGSMSLIYPTYVLKAKLVRLEALYPSC